MLRQQVYCEMEHKWSRNLYSKVNKLPLKMNEIQEYNKNARATLKKSKNIIQHCELKQIFNSKINYWIVLRLQSNIEQSKDL